MIQDYEENIIAPPLEFRDNYKPIPKPRAIKSKRPIPPPRTKITPIKQALRDAVKTDKVDLKDKNDPLIQLQSTRHAIEYYFNKSYVENNKNFKFYESLRVTF